VCEPVQFTGSRVHEVEISTDVHTCISFGTTKAGKPVTILSQALVSMLLMPSVPSERILVLATHDNARRLSALANQEELPVRARAVFDGACWEIMSILPKDHATIHETRYATAEDTDR
jgi:hypothetical protein